MSMSNNSWDPLATSKSEAEALPEYQHRLSRDISAVCTDPPDGILVEPDESDIRMVHALIEGSAGTPYEKGFFYFVMRCPPKYPFQPPKVRLMTTDGGHVRFNPNLYNCGKVCLSILGTYSGPGWQCSQNIQSVLLSIQSIMNEKPYHNEPGYEKEIHAGDAGLYNQMILHETIRVAVCGMLENNTGLALPLTFIRVMQEKFLKNFKYYEEVIRKSMGLSEKSFQDNLFNTRGKFQYAALLERIQTIHSQLAAH